MVATAEIHLGDLPTWLAALGTVGALGAALWQISTERKRRHEREEQQREERHLAQARLIAAVIGPEEQSGGADSIGADRHRPDQRFSRARLPPRRRDRKYSGCRNVDHRAVDRILGP